VLELTNGAVLHTYTVPHGSGGLAFSADGRELAALGCCSPASSIEVWDVTSGTELFSPRVAGQAQSMAFLPTSAVLAAGTADGKVLFWDARRGKQLSEPITPAASNVLQITFSPDGRLLAAGLRNGSTILLDLKSRQQLGSSFPALGGIPLPLFAPNGDLLINYVGSTADWPTNLAAWERFACQVAGRDLTPTEWTSVLPNRPYQHVCPA
jgi:WD40 repeat protein